MIKPTDSCYAQSSFFNTPYFHDPVGLETHHGVTTMATAILHSIKQGAYIAISLYVVFIAVVTVTSMNPQLKSHSVESAAPAMAELDRAALNAQERAS
jgi:hypothetical protein